MRVFSIYRHVAGTAQMPAEKRVAEQLFFGSESELKRQRGQSDRNVHVALVITAKYICGSVGQMLEPRNVQFYAASPQDHSRPDAGTTMLNAAVRVDQ